MAEASRNKSFEGYDEEFVDEVHKDIQCAVCRLTLRSPVQTDCGHRFCRTCLEQSLESQSNGGRPTSCPCCRSIIPETKNLFSDKAMEKWILSLAIRCPNEGCLWTGELRNKENHLARCNKCPVACTNKCGSSIPREMVSTHFKEECPLTIIPCPFEQMGCTSKIERRSVDSHLQSDVRTHLDLARAKLDETERRLNDTERRSNDTERRFNDTERRLKDTERRLDDTERRSNDTERRLNDTERRLKDTERRLDDTERRLKDTERRSSDTERRLNETDRKTTALLQMTRLKLEPLDKKVFIWKIDGFCKILRRAKTGKRSIESDPFDTTTGTESYGYKIQALIYPNGIYGGENTHLSVSIVLLKGEYDAILPWPMNKKVKFILIDQQQHPGERKNFSSEVLSTNKWPEFARPACAEPEEGRGFETFISHEELNSGRYIVNDTLFLRVEISSPPINFMQQT